MLAELSVRYPRLTFGQALKGKRIDKDRRTIDELNIVRRRIFQPKAVLKSSLMHVEGEEGRVLQLTETPFIRVRDERDGLGANDFIGTDEDIAVLDAGVKLADVHASGLERFLLRLETNFTACRNQPLPYGGKGRRPVYGEKIRPLERCYKGKTIAASAPDRVKSWVEDSVALRAEIWDDLILPGVVPGPQAKTFRVYAIYDPDYKTPWLLATPLNLKPATVRALLSGSLAGRADPALGQADGRRSHRQFVHADESIQRLPGLALLAGSILSYLAARAPLAPTGFWGIANRSVPRAASAACWQASHFRNLIHCLGNFAKRPPQPGICPRATWPPGENRPLLRRRDIILMGEQLHHARLDNAVIAGGFNMLYSEYRDETGHKPAVNLERLRHMQTISYITGPLEGGPLQVKD